MAAPATDTNGFAIREMRRLQGMTVERLAELTKISHVTLRQYELERRRPSAERAWRIASALNVELAAILRTPLTTPLQFTDGEDRPPVPMPEFIDAEPERRAS